MKFLELYNELKDNYDFEIRFINDENIFIHKFWVYRNTKKIKIFAFDELLELELVTYCRHPLKDCYENSCHVLLRDSNNYVDRRIKFNREEFDKKYIKGKK